jgi:redox-sensitive bicupin YhaK (pirin superfamily)
MTAGTGVRHSEHNLHDKPLRFIQLWFAPRARGLQPTYGSMRGDAAKRHNQWHHIVTDVLRKDHDPSEDDADTDDADAAVAITINQDVDMFVTDLDQQRSLLYTLRPGRQVS